MRPLHNGGVGHSFSLVVVERDPRQNEQIVSAIGGAIPAIALGSLEELEPWASPDNVTVAVFGPSFAAEAAFGHMGEFLGAHRTVQGVLAAKVATKALLQRALRAGLADIVSWPVVPQEVCDAIERALEAATRTERLAEPWEPPAVEHPSGRGRLISVFGAKGGAGKSMVAANVGALLAMAAPGPECLVDANFQFPDDAMILQLKPSPTIDHVLGVGTRLNEGSLRPFLQRHEDSGLLVLPGPSDQVMADLIKGADVVRIVEALLAFCSYVLVDCPPYFTDTAVQVLQAADDVLVVASMDTLNMKNVRLVLQTLEHLGVRDEDVKVVVNRANSKAWIDHRDIRRVIGREPVCWIPSDVVVPESINTGRPFVLSKPRSGVARSIDELTHLLLSETPIRVEEPVPAVRRADRGREVG